MSPAERIKNLCKLSGYPVAKVCKSHKSGDYALIFPFKIPELIVDFVKEEYHIFAMSDEQILFKEYSTNLD